MDVLTSEQVAQELTRLDGWEHQGDSIVHTKTLADFKAALLYVGAVGYLAEAASHHPDIEIQWNKVRLTLSTHSAGGLTRKDFALAGQLSQLG